MPTKLKRITFMVPAELESELEQFSKERSDGNISDAVRILVGYGLVTWRKATKSSPVVDATGERH